MRMGRNYHVTDDRDIEIVRVLPPDLYQVCHNAMTGQFWLSPQDKFKLPEKLYGDVEKDARRILNTFHNRPLTTGVHLNGLKGSGKTLLGKKISDIAYTEMNIPVLLITEPYIGDGFNKFIREIDTPTVIMFDEFEKVYERKDQEELLTLLDGLYNTKKMFIITSNDQYKVTEYLHNRPGRIYYSLQFNALDPQFVREFCQDNLDNKKEVESIVSYSQVYPDFNFDMLNSIVEEMNRYKESLGEVLEWLNIIPVDRKIPVELTVEFGKEKIKITDHYEFSPTNFHFNFNTKYLGDTYETYLESEEYNEDLPIKKALKTAQDGKHSIIIFSDENLTSFDKEKGVYTYSKELAGRLLKLHFSKKKETGLYDAWLKMVA